jgi:hypothetical protein
MLFDGERIIGGLLDRLLPNRAAPVLGKVIRAHEGPGKNTYAVDVRVVRAGSLEETGQMIAEVPVNPVWAGEKGKGLYAVPPEGAVVIVGFLQWNPAWPYVSGIWSNDYEAGAFKKGQLLITDGEGLQFGVDVDALFLFETKNQSMKKVLNKILDVVAKIQTKGAPPQHVGDPVWVQELLAIKPDIAALLK